MKEKTKSKMIGTIRFSYSFDVGLNDSRMIDVDVELPFDLEQISWQKATEKLEKEFWEFINKDAPHKREVTTELTEEMVSGFRDFLIHFCGDGTLMNILKGIFNGEPQMSIAQRLEISQAAISERIKHFGESKLGYLAEEYFRNVAGDKRNIVGRANPSQPDVITKSGEIWSIKSSIRYHASHVIYPITDCSPELREAMNQRKNFKIIYVNPLWGDNPLEQEINPRKPLEWVSFYKSGEIRTPY